MGRALPRAVLGAVGESVEAIDAATWAIEPAQRIITNVRRSAGNRRAPAPSLRPGQEDALLQLGSAPLTTVGELARFNRVPATTLRGRLERLAELVDSMSHRLGALGPKTQRRYFLTEKGIQAAAAFEWGTERFWPTTRCPVSGFAPGRAPRRRGRALPRRRSCSRRRPPGQARGGPLPPGGFRPAHYALRRPLGGHPAPGADPPPRPTCATA